MRILICHGYRLRGTGSNQYVQSLARELCRQRHQLVIMCEEEDPRLDFVSVFLEEGEDPSAPNVVWSQRPSYPGTCMVYRPNIGDLLPVYVLDTYPGREAREFPDLGDDELEAYVAAIRESLKSLLYSFLPEAIMTNHAVMLPYIVRPLAEAANISYYAVIHGSAIEFTVKRDERYLEYGIDGLTGARRLIVPSRYAARLVREVFEPGEPDIEGKLDIVPIGVDTEVFHPARESLSGSVERLLEMVEQRTEGASISDIEVKRETTSRPAEERHTIDADIARINAENPDWMPVSDLAEQLHRLARDDEPFLIFVGKLLETKGIQCVLPALPLILWDHPGTRLVVVGFGGLRGILQLMLESLDRGDIRSLVELCHHGDRVYRRVERPFSTIIDFLDTLAGEGTLDDYVHRCRALDLQDAVDFTGYLTQEEHSLLLPHSRALLAPSIAPEAFGMIVTEAMASGVIPICTDHSGLSDALAPLRKTLADEAENFILATPEKYVFRIAGASKSALEMQESRSESIGLKLKEEVERRFSWRSVTARLVGIMKNGVA